MKFLKLILFKTTISILTLKFYFRKIENKCKRQKKIKRVLDSTENLKGVENQNPILDTCVLMLHFSMSP